MTRPASLDNNPPGPVISSGSRPFSASSSASSGSRPARRSATASGGACDSEASAPSCGRRLDCMVLMVMGSPFCGPPAVAARAARPSGAPDSGGHGSTTPRSHHHDHTHFIGQTLPARLDARDLAARPSIRRERELARFRLHLVKHRSMLKHRVHATMISFGHPCPVTDLFGVAGRELLDRLAIPQPWRQTVDASLTLMDYLEAQIQAINKQLRALGPEHRYMPLLMTVPGIGWV